LDLLPIAVDELLKMGLTVFVSGQEYRTGKPDLVIVYKDKSRYYLAEVVSDDCLGEESTRLRTDRADATSRDFCRLLYTDRRKACWAAALYCDLGQGFELFGYTHLMGINLHKMQKYAAIISSANLLKESEIFFTEHNLQYRSLMINKYFALTLFSQPDSAKLPETRRFMQFLMSNR
jgi:hypothetical protein